MPDSPSPTHLPRRIQTSLILPAGGVALETLSLGHQVAFRLTASLLLVLVGILTPLQAWIG